MTADVTSWGVCALVDIAETYSGSTPSRSRLANYGGDIPWVKSTEINNDIIQKTEETLSREGMLYSSARWIPKKTPLIAMYGATAGQVAWLTIRATTNQAVLAVIPRSEATDARWLFWTLSHQKRKMIALTQGSGQPNLSKSIIDALTLPLPETSEQEKIASILDTLDATIRTTEQLITKLEKVKQGLLHDLLTRGINENGELRDPVRHPEQFKESVLGRVPKEWDVNSFSQIVAAPICYGIVQPGPYYPGGPFVLAIRDLGGDFNKNVHRTSPRIHGMYLRSSVQPGDVLLSIKGTIGRTAVAPPWYEGNISRDIARLRLNSSVLPEFAHYYLQSETGQRRLQAAVVGTTRSEISIHILRDIHLPLGPKSEQIEISKRLAALSQRIVSTVSEVNKLKTLRQGLMDDLLTGRVRVTHLLEDA